MNKYKDYEDKFAPAPVVPVKQYSYFGYKAGDSKEFPILAEAKAFSKNFEAVIINADERIKIGKELVKWQAQVKTAWKEDLFKEFLQFNKWLPVDVHASDKHIKIFELIFTKAWDDGHAYGCDAVVDTFEDLLEFIEPIVKLVTFKESIL